MTFLRVFLAENRVLAVWEARAILARDSKQSQPIRPAPPPHRSGAYHHVPFSTLWHIQTTE